MKINLLFSIDDRFTSQMKTTLYSIYANTSPKNQFYVYVLQKAPLQDNATIQQFCEKLNMTYFPVIIGDDGLFKNAPISDRYPETIYYRLLAHLYLPKEVTKILYVDADILCINDITTLYKIDVKDYLYAAASHSQLTNMSNVFNKVRLRTYESEGYFNSGVLLMNLDKIRQMVDPKDIFRFIEENQLNLFLPDQDILNGMYSDNILAIPDQVFNYDARKYGTYETISMGLWDLDWIFEQCVILHFCGKDKPWERKYRGRFASLYKHYWYKTLRLDRTERND